MNNFSPKANTGKFFNFQLQSSNIPGDLTMIKRDFIPQIRYCSMNNIPEIGVWEFYDVYFEQDFGSEAAGTRCSKLHINYVEGWINVFKGGDSPVKRMSCHLGTGGRNPNLTGIHFPGFKSFEEFRDFYSCIGKGAKQMEKFVVEITDHDGVYYWREDGIVDEAHATLLSESVANEVAARVKLAFPKCNVRIVYRTDEQIKKTPEQLMEEAMQSIDKALAANKNKTLTRLQELVCKNSIPE